jgi:hypothetical protein
MTSFDLVLLLVISNAVQNSINAGDNSARRLTGQRGDPRRAQLVRRVRDMAVAPGGAHRPRARPFASGRTAGCTSERCGGSCSRSELDSVLRKKGIMRVSNCKHVTLEPDETQSVVHRDLEQRPLTELAHPDLMFVPDSA